MKGPGGQEWPWHWLEFSDPGHLFSYRFPWSSLISWQLLVRGPPLHPSSTGCPQPPSSASARSSPRLLLWAQQHLVANNVSQVKNPPANSGDMRDVGSIPGSGRSPGGGHGNPLQYSCLENLMDRGTWWATVHEITKESDTTESIACATFPGLGWYLQCLSHPLCNSRSFLKEKDLFHFVKIILFFNFYF